MDRLQAYLATHLIPVDFIQEYQAKRLPLSLLFFKVCTSFPRERLGSNKSAAKHLDYQKLSFLKEFVGETHYKEIIKLRSSHRPKNGQYVEFLTTSLLLTASVPTLLTFPSAAEDITQGWDFKIQDQAFDITTNLFKSPKPGVALLKLDLTKILDQHNLLLPDALTYVGQELQSAQIPVDNAKIQYANLLVNKVRSKYLELTAHEVIKRTVLPTTVVAIPQPPTWSIPPLAAPIVDQAQVTTTAQVLAPEDLQLLQLIKNLSPEKRTVLLQTLRLLA